MMSIERSTTVADLVVEGPALARLFEQLGIDYCCGGKRSLEEACASRGLDVATAIALLEADGGAPEGEAEDWARAPLGELCDHIVEAHHALLRRELPRLSTLLGKVEVAHGPERPELAEVRSVFEEMRDELEEHMEKEELVLFPLCAAVGSGAPAPRFVASAVAVLEDDHASTGPRSSVCAG